MKTYNTPDLSSSVSVNAWDMGCTRALLPEEYGLIDIAQGITISAVKDDDPTTFLEMVFVGIDYRSMRNEKTIAEIITHCLNNMIESRTTVLAAASTAPEGHRFNTVETHWRPRTSPPWEGAGYSVTIHATPNRFIRGRGEYQAGIHQNFPSGASPYTSIAGSESYRHSHINAYGRFRGIIPYHLNQSVEATLDSIVSKTLDEIGNDDAAEHVNAAMAATKALFAPVLDHATPLSIVVNYDAAPAAVSLGNQSTWMLPTSQVWRVEDPATTSLEQLNTGNNYSLGLGRVGHPDASLVTFGGQNAIMTNIFDNYLQNLTGISQAIIDTRNHRTKTFFGHGGSDLGVLEGAPKCDPQFTLNTSRAFHGRISRILGTDFGGHITQIMGTSVLGGMLDADAVTYDADNKAVIDYDGVWPKRHTHVDVDWTDSEVASIESYMEMYGNAFGLREHEEGEVQMNQNDGVDVAQTQLVLEEAKADAGYKYRGFVMTHTSSYDPDLLYTVFGLHLADDYNEGVINEMYPYLSGIMTEIAAM